MLSACGSGSSSSTTSPTTPSTTTAPASVTTFQGTIAGSDQAQTTGQSGTINVTIQTKIASLRSTNSFSLASLSFIQRVYAQGTTISASGNLHIAGGATTTLTGNYDSSAKTVSLSGGGYAFSGAVASSGVSGTYTGPNTVAGGFSALPASGGSVTRFCGNYTSTVPFTDANGNGGTYHEAGVWNVQISANGSASGLSIPSSYSYSGNAGGPHPAAAVGFITGQLSGNTLTLMSSEGGTLVATVQGSSVSGTAVSPKGTGGGPFTGSTAACQ